MSQPPDPRRPWLALAAALRCRPQFHVRGRPSARMTLAGALGGCQLRFWFDDAPARVEVWICADQNADSIAFAATTRLCPRSALPGWGVADPTGDPVFDDAVLVLAEDIEPLLLRLDPATRALAVALVGQGAHTFDGGVWLPPAVTTQAQTNEAAADLLDAATALAGALHGRTPQAEAVIALVHDASAGHVAEAALAWVERPVKSGGPGTFTLLRALAAQPTNVQVHWLLRLLPQSDAEWAQWVARALPLDDPAIEAHLTALLKSRAEQRGRLPELAAHRLVRALERGDPAETVARLGAVVLSHPGALDPVLERARDGSPAVIGWLSGLRFGAQPGHQVDLAWPPSQWRVAHTLFLLSAAGAEDRLAAATPDPRVAIAELAQCVDRLPLGRALALGEAWVEVWAQARDTDAERLLDALVPWFDLRPLPAALGSLMVRCGDDLLVAAAARLPGRCTTDTQRAHAARFLTATLADRPRRVATVLTALEALGTPAAEPFLLQVLAAGEDALRPALLAALGTCGSLACVPALERLDGFFEDRTTRALAREALALVRARGWVSSAGGLSVSAAEAGGLSPEAPPPRG